MTSPLATGQATSATGDPRREQLRAFLERRYNGVIPVTDEMVQAVLDGLDEED
jgi:hypothetical protein